MRHAGVARRPELARTAASATRSATPRGCSRTHLETTSGGIAGEMALENREDAAGVLQGQVARRLACRRGRHALSRCGVRGGSYLEVMSLNPVLFLQHFPGELPFLGVVGVPAPSWVPLVAPVALPGRRIYRSLHLASVIWKPLNRPARSSVSRKPSWMIVDALV